MILNRDPKTIQAEYVKVGKQIDEIYKECKRRVEFLKHRQELLNAELLLSTELYSMTFNQGEDNE